MLKVEHTKKFTNKREPISHKYSQYIENTSFKFIVTAYNHSVPQSRQRQVVESFSYMALLGKIDMKTPDVTFMCFEEYIDKHGRTREKLEGDGEFRQVFFGRLIAEGTARPLVNKFDVKKRSYFGNTSMDAEVSLLMANQTLVSYFAQNRYHLLIPFSGIPW
ncbi:hypothetical protein QCA50_020206 [Cerrena zonata]|uniref:tRNA (guanine(10)-N(2))-methyltransferase TRMT11 N-terminal domain-containing protein n=1 Tax=Cerrena zonata TaxID=2478898 RepID=A0AAW0FJP3_9APHY